MTEPSGNGWDVWKNHVLSEVTDNKSEHTQIREKLELIHKDIAGLKIKSGVWGAIGGAIPFVLFVVAWAVKSILGE